MGGDMARHKLFSILTVLIGFFVTISACSREGAKTSQHASQKSYGGIIAGVRKQTLPDYPSTTIGNAFDSYEYLKNKEWKMEQMKTNHFVVDFYGWFDADTLDERARRDSIAERGLDVKFVVTPDGRLYIFKIALLEGRSDGKIYSSPINDIAGILTSIYANKKISL